MRGFEIALPRTIAFSFVLFLLLGLRLVSAQDPTILRDGMIPRYFEGEYEEVIELCERIESRYSGPFATLVLQLKARALQDTGRTEAAWLGAAAQIEKRPDDLVALILAYELAQELGKGDEAKEILTSLNKAAAKKTSTRTPAEWVALGKAALLLGAKPDTVFKSYFGKAKQLDPSYPDSWVAAGELALEKHDYTRAAREFTEGAKKFPANTDFVLGLAKANAPSDEQKAREFLAGVLRMNKSHPGALVMMARFHLDAEEHDRCELAIKSALAVCPDHPEAWALYAALAHYRNEEGELEERRTKGLERNDKNPLVDFRIGEALARKRRFEEGAAHQKKALEFDPAYTPAKLELAMDLLRLGREEEAWELVAVIRKEDPYSVLAYNLALLQKKLETFVTLEEEGFRVKMAPGEASVYGARVFEILKDAHERLAAKYGYEAKGPVLVEFFPRQKDFAVRTLGVPGGSGLLGACFGSVVTMNSPGGAGAGINNWEATLYHEYCHVITLGASKNRMPRWLSEGISVYEEIMRDPTWGQKMNPSYRARILDSDEGLDPIAQMSRPFMSPRDGADLMFGYYESSLVVGYLIEKGGNDVLRLILADLAKGVPVLESIEDRAGDIAELEKGFRAYAEKAAKALPGKVDWSIPDFENSSPVQVLEGKPNNYIALSARASQLAGEGKWEEVKTVATKLTSLWPDDAGRDSPWLLLAEAERRLGNEEAEAKALRELSQRSSEALPAFRRLLDIEAEKADWTAVLQNSRKHLAINPMVAAVHGRHGEALEEAGEPAEALDAYRRWLALGPLNPARAHFNVARLLKEKEPEESKRHLLDALAEAPRFREAHRLLQEMQPQAEKIETE